MVTLHEGENRQNGLSSWLSREIKEFVAASPENSLKNDTGERAWDEPLVGFSERRGPPLSLD